MIQNNLTSSKAPMELQLVEKTITERPVFCLLPVRSQIAEFPRVSLVDWANWTCKLNLADGQILFSTVSRIGMKSI